MKNVPIDQRLSAATVLADPVDALLTREAPTGWSFEPISIRERPLVSVVMTAYNSERYIGAALQSLLAQSYGNLEILVVDDGSEDDTCQCVAAVAATDKRVRLLPLTVNRGTYSAKNVGIVLARGSLVTFMDSDDVAHPLRIQRQLEEICAHGVAGSTTRYVRILDDGSVRESKRNGLITLMLRREVFECIGYFDSVRTSADEEFFLRVKLAFGEQGVANINQPLYIARVRAGSLSMDPKNAVISKDTGGLSPARAEYFKAFNAWHDVTARSNRIPFFPFPLFARPFTIDPILAPKATGGGGSLTAIIDATCSGPTNLRELLREVGPMARRIIVIVLEDADLPQGEITFITANGCQDPLDEVDGVEFPSGRVVMLDARWRYPSGFLRELVLWGELAGENAVVGCSLERDLVQDDSQPLAKVDSLVVGTLTFHSAAAGDVHGDRSILRSTKIRAQRFLGVVALSRRMVYCAGGGAPGFVASKRVATQGTEYPEMGEPGGEKRDLATGGAGAGSRDGGPLTPGSRTRKAFSLAKAFAAYRALRREVEILVRLFLSPWSMIEVAILGGSVLLATLTAAALTSALGLAGTAAVSVVVLFFGFVSAFLARRVRVAATQSVVSFSRIAVRTQLQRIRGVFRTTRRLENRIVAPAAKSAHAAEAQGYTSGRVLGRLGSSAIEALRNDQYTEALRAWLDATRLARTRTSEQASVQLLTAGFAAAAGHYFWARLLAFGAASAVSEDPALQELYSLLAAPSDVGPADIKDAVTRLV